jgi:hypothetical protein
VDTQCAVVPLVAIELVCTVGELREVFH